MRTNMLCEPDAELDRLAHEVIGAAIEVHRVRGPGLSESHYEKALALELRSRGIPFAVQPSVSVLYNGDRIGDGRLKRVIHTPQ
jgi:GxxExxY protein